MVHRTDHKKLANEKTVYEVHAFLVTNRNVVIKKRERYFTNESLYILWPTDD